MSHRNIIEALVVDAIRKAEPVDGATFVEAIRQDVEAVFIFPWATRLEAYALFGLIEMAIFVYILLLGLVYAWRKGMLRWV